MERDSRDNTIVYTLLDIADGSFRQPNSSTPSATGRRETAMDERRTSQQQLLESIDFDGPSPLTTRTAARKVTTEVPRRALQKLPYAEASGDTKRLPMKRKKFDGTGFLESFLAQFDVCARRNQWTAVDKVDFLKCSLDKAASQLLWDFWAHTDVTYEQLVGLLRQRYGAEGQAETFRAQLYYRRQRSEESLSDHLHDIRRLAILAYPVPANETTEIVAKDAFLEAIGDKELSLKVREREPRTIEEVYRVALRFAAYQQTSELEERRRLAQVRGAKESDPVEKLQRQMEKFFNEQRHWQQDWETKMNSRLEEAPRRQPEQEATNGGRRSRGERFACYNCGRLIARNCRQRWNHQWQDPGAEDKPPNEPAEPPVTNNTTRVRPVGDMKNAVYVRCTINGRSTLGLVDTGSEVSLVPLSIVQGVFFNPRNEYCWLRMPPE